MSRVITLAVLIASIASAAGDPIWDELGLQSSEKVEHGTYQVTRWHFKDSTGALAGVGQIVALPSHPKAVQTGNYVVSCEGNCPKTAFDLPADAPGRRGGALPVFQTYLPRRGISPQSERYLIGPVGLGLAVPEIPVSAAAFQFGTEAALAKYRIGTSDVTVVLFSYPAPQMARQQFPQFEKIPGAIAKRSGPMIGIALNAPNENVANTLLKDIEYQASLSWDKQPPLIIRPQTAAQIVLGAIELAGIILVFCLMSGLAYGGFRLLQRRFGNLNADESMIVLGLGSK